MSPGFRNVLRLARIPVDSSEPVRREIWQPADWHCDDMSASASGFRRSAVGFHFVAGHLGGWRLYWPVPGRGINPEPLI